MSRKLTRPTLLIAALVLMNIATLTTLWLRPMGPPPPGRPGADRFLIKELNLNEEQAAKFKRFREEHFEKTKGLDREMREGRRLIIEELAKNPPDTTAAFAIKQKHLSNIATLDSLLIDHYLELRKLLTTEQQEKLGHVFLESIRPPGAPKAVPKNGTNK